jgi:fermentation-respiration switch protein FrsA (DUF1100 family)
MRLAVATLGVLMLLWVGVNVAVAWGATHPLQQAKLLGSAPVHRRTPAAVHLAYETVTYAPKRDAWWIAAPSPAASIVLIHGYDVVPDPKSADPAPMLDLAVAFHDWGCNALIINLGYATGVHAYSGGPLEADDIAAAVHWLQTKDSRLPIVLWGFSDGGHSALLAVARHAPVAAVAADSAFVDANEVIRDQGAKFFHAPPVLLAPSILFVRLFAGAGPVDLAGAIPATGLSQPALLIQGAADRAISTANLRRLAVLTKGRSVMIPGADHVGSYRMSPMVYLQVARDFLRRLSANKPPSPAKAGHGEHWG